MYIKLLLLIIVIICYCSPVIEGLFIEDWYHIIFDPIMGNHPDHKKLVQEHYKELMNNFTKIFPDNNRNAGGVQFYHYIDTHKETLTKDKFMLYHTFYCAVSGSPIDPDRKDIFNHVIVDHVDGKRKFVGKYYRCCTPCLADIMKYTKVEHHTVTLKDGPHTHLVLTIDDPCNYENKIPDEVTSFKCSDGKTMNGVRTKNNRLIIGVLHESEEYDPSKHDDIVKYSLDISKERMNTHHSELVGGMGDIFVKLSIIKEL